MSLSIVVFSGAISVIVITSVLIGVFSFKKIIENKPIEYYDVFIENGCFSKKYA